MYVCLLLKQHPSPTSSRRGWDKTSFQPASQTLLFCCYIASHPRARLSPNDIAKKHRLSLVLVGLFYLATNGSLVLIPNGRLSLVTVGREDRQGPTTTDVFLQYHLGSGIQGRNYSLIMKVTLVFCVHIIHGGPTGFNTGNWSIPNAVWEMSY